MSKINLAKALKVKNSLVRELNRNKDILKRENVKTTTNPGKTDYAALLAAIEAKTKALIDIKSKITVANVGIYPALAEMEELKSQISYYQTLPVQEGVVHQGYGADSRAVEYVAHVTQATVDAKVAALQTRIEELQDQVDAFNATTFIEV